MAGEPVIRGMILAAGYGTRLAPVTDHLPKPLLSVGEGTLLDHALAAFERAGISEVAVNTHHLGGMIASHLQQRKETKQVTVFHEDEILGTGGALDGARSFLEAADHFIVFNGDVLCNVDLSALMAAHLKHGNLGTMLLVDRPRFNTVHVNEKLSVVHIDGAGPLDEKSIPPGCKALTYAGVGIFSRAILDDIGPGFSSLISPLVRSLAAQCDSVKGFEADGVFWDDLGTLHSYLKVSQDLLQNPKKFQWLGEGTTFTGGPLDLKLITGHGSDRKFWRLSTTDWSAVAMQSATDKPGNEEFQYQLDIGRFLHRHDLGTAEVLSVDAAGGTMLMEDLGQASLFFLGRNPGTPEHLLAQSYRQVVDHLLKLQSFTDTARQQCPSAVERCLDYDVLRWETAYFREQFLHRHLGLKEEETRHLLPVFEDLANCVAHQPQVLLHRDFQSQNIHFHKGKVRLVDIQGLRLGPIGYDIMSLVWDPYVDLPDGLRDELLDRFAAGCAGQSDDTRAMCVAAGLQRLMQALGAYGFLGHAKMKQEFLAHIPRGVANLKALLKTARTLYGDRAAFLPDSLSLLESFLKSHG